MGAEELMPDRAPELVRSKLKRFFHPDNYKGVYSPQEDAMLLRYGAHDGATPLNVSLQYGTRAWV